MQDKITKRAVDKHIARFILAGLYTIGLGIPRFTVPHSSPRSVVDENLFSQNGSGRRLLARHRSVAIFSRGYSELFPAVEVQ